MLSVTLCKVRAGTSRERTARRLEYQYPEGVKILGEWWLQNPDTEVIIVSEAESVAPILAASAAWDDVFHITVVPAVTAEEGMAIARQAMPK